MVSALRKQNTYKVTSTDTCRTLYYCDDGQLKPACQSKFQAVHACCWVQSLAITDLHRQNRPTALPKCLGFLFLSFFFFKSISCCLSAITIDPFSEVLWHYLRDKKLIHVEKQMRGKLLYSYKLNNKSPYITYLTL